MLVNLLGRYFQHDVVQRNLLEFFCQVHPPSGRQKFRVAHTELLELGFVRVAHEVAADDQGTDDRTLRQPEPYKC